MAHVDAFRRAPVEADDRILDNLNRKKFRVFGILEEAARIIMMQRNDEDFRKFIDIFRKTVEERFINEKNKTKNYQMGNGRLYNLVKVVKEERLLYVFPIFVQKAKVVKYHDMSGHFLSKGILMDVYDRRSSSRVKSWSGTPHSTNI